MRESGCPGRGDAEDGDEAAEEDSLAAMFGEKALASGQIVLGVATGEPGAVEQPAPASARDQ